MDSQEQVILDELKTRYLTLSKKDKVPGNWGAKKLTDEVKRLESENVTKEDETTNAFSHDESIETEAVEAKTTSTNTEKVTIKAEEVPIHDAELPEIKIEVKKIDGESEEAPEPPKKLYGNLRPDIEIGGHDQNQVLFYLTDGGALRKGGPRDQVDRDEDWPPKRISRMTPENFWRCFGSEYTNDGRFENVKNAVTVVRIFRNLNPEILESTLKFELSKAKNRQQYDSIMEYYIKYFKNLRLNGSNQVIKPGDIIHVPGLVDKDKFPEECLPQSKYFK